MYVSIDQETSRRRREEIMREVRVARLPRMARGNREGKPRLLRDPRWELAR